MGVKRKQGDNMLSPITRFLNSFGDDYILILNNRDNEYKCYKYKIGTLTNYHVPKKKAEELFKDGIWKKVHD